MIGLGLDEAFELGPGLLQQLAPAHQVAALRRLVDLGPPLLVIQDDLQVGRELGVGSELVDELEGQVVQPAIPQLLEEPQGRPRVLAPLGRDRPWSQQSHEQQPDLKQSAARHERLLERSRPREQPHDAEPAG